MAVFKDHKLPLSRLLEVIPETEFAQLSKATGVDHYSKVLQGKLLFNLLLYAQLTEDRIGQRGIADMYSSPHFRLLFNIESKKEKLSHSSLSERLSVIKVDYFRYLYEYIYHRYSELYPGRTIAGLELHRVDSTLVAETSNKLSAGLTGGNEYRKRKMLKYTIGYDGMYGVCARIHTEGKYWNESLALPENVLEHFKKNEDRRQVYIFDRGQSSTDAFSGMKNQKGLRFVGRLVENRKMKVIRTFDLIFKRFTQGELKQDALVQLYRKEVVISRNGKKSNEMTLVAETFRVIRFRPKDKDEDIVLITNLFHLPAETIALMYRRRWDIEVFFRFLKQEVNFSHFISLNENGIQVILYMTLIAAMLIMIYKKENELGFKTAKRRIQIELQQLIIAIAVVMAGGDLSKVQLPAP